MYDSIGLYQITCRLQYVFSIDLPAFSYNYHVCPYRAFTVETIGSLSLLREIHQIKYIGRINTVNNILNVHWPPNVTNEIDLMRPIIKIMRQVKFSQCCVKRQW